MNFFKPESTFPWKVLLILHKVKWKKRFLMYKTIFKWAKS